MGFTLATIALIGTYMFQSYHTESEETSVTEQEIQPEPTGETTSEYSGEVYTVEFNLKPSFSSSSEE